MERTVEQVFEQFRDIYCGRATYNNDEEWVANMDAEMAELCNHFPMDFEPMENKNES